MGGKKDWITELNFSSFLAKTNRSSTLFNKDKSASDIVDNKLMLVKERNHSGD